MNNLKLIMLLCILTQGCSSGSHEQINQPVSAIPALEAAPLTTLSSEKIINPDVDGAPRLQIDADEVIYDDGESVAGSDNTDYLPKPPSYWM